MKIDLRMIAAMCVLLVISGWHNTILCGDFVAMWEDRLCEEAKSHIIDDPVCHITFTGKPTVGDSCRCWKIRWSGIDILLPPVAYRNVFVGKKRNEYDQLSLSTEDGIRVAAMVFADEPMEDIFGNGYLDRMDTTNDGKVLTQAIYGGSVRLSTVKMSAYRFTPEDITCRKGRFNEEYPVYNAILLKNRNTVAAHEKVGRYDGWIHIKDWSVGRIYTLYILPEIEEELEYWITYTLPKDSNLHDLPFQVGGDFRNEGAPSAPDWLVALNKALAVDTRESWNAYFREAEKGGIDKESIERTRENVAKISP